MFLCASLQNVAYVDRLAEAAVSRSHIGPVFDKILSPSPPFVGPCFPELLPFYIHRVLGSGMRQHLLAPNTPGNHAKDIGLHLDCFGDVSRLVVGRYGRHITTRILDVL